MSVAQWIEPNLAGAASLAELLAPWSLVLGSVLAFLGAVAACFPRRSERTAMAALAAMGSAMLQTGAGTLLPPEAASYAPWAALVASGLGLLAPKLGAALFLASLGQLLGKALGGFFPGQDEVVWLSGAVVGLIAAWATHDGLLAPLTRLVASVSLAAGGWLLVLARLPRGVWSTPAVWLGVAAGLWQLLGVVARTIEARNGPRGGSEDRGGRKTERSAADKEAELRKRYARYYE